MSDLAMRGKPSDTELLDAMIDGRWAITKSQGLYMIRDQHGLLLALDRDPRRAIEQARLRERAGGATS